MDKTQLLYLSDNINNITNVFCNCNHSLLSEEDMAYSHLVYSLKKIEELEELILSTKQSILTKISTTQLCAYMWHVVYSIIDILNSNVVQKTYNTILSDGYSGKCTDSSGAEFILTISKALLCKNNETIQDLLTFDSRFHFTINSNYLIKVLDKSVRELYLTSVTDADIINYVGIYDSLHNLLLSPTSECTNIIAKQITDSVEFVKNFEKTLEDYSYMVKEYNKKICNKALS